MSKNYKFYTSVSSSFNGVRLTGVWGGKRFIRESVRGFNPELYIPHHEGMFLGTDGEKLKRLEFETVSEYWKFLKEGREIENLKMYGEISPEYQFICKHFTGDIKYDKSLMNLTYFDIETASLDPKYRPTNKDIFVLKNQPVVSIALYHSMYDEVVVFGLKPYDKTKSEHTATPITYIECYSEIDLLERFASHITSCKYRPDLLMGWYSSGFDIPYLIARCLTVGGKKLARSLSVFNDYNSFTMPKKTSVGVFKDTEIFTIAGLQHVDLQDAYKQFSGRSVQQSYKLDFIAKRELSRGKLDYGDMNIFDFYHKDHQKYIDYNILDTYLLKLLDDKIGLSTRIIATAFSNKCNFSDTIGTTKQWDTRLYDNITKMGLIIPYKAEREKVSYVGGYVRDSMLGVHKWVMTKDVTSEYPRCIIMCNMSPETLTTTPDETCARSANGVYFRTDIDGIIAQAAVEIFDKRSSFKKVKSESKRQLDLIKQEMNERGIVPNLKTKAVNTPDLYNHAFDKGLHTITDSELNQLYADVYEIMQSADVDQYIMKILVNSLYGSLGSRFFRFYHPDIAEAITKTGQYIIKSFAETLNNCMNRINNTKDQSYVEVDIDDPSNNQEVGNIHEDYLVMGDTDSCAISFESYVDNNCQGWSDTDIINEILRLDNEIIQPEIDNTINEIYKELNVKNKGLEFGTETIAKKAVYLVKKHYLGHIVWDEGKFHLDEDNPELKIKGLEGVKSSTSLYFQEKLADFYKIAMLGTQDDAIKLIDSVKNEYSTLDVEDMGKPIKIRELAKWIPQNPDDGIYIKGTHENAKAALIYNHWLHKLGITHDYSEIKEGDAVNLIKLREPNLIRERVIAIPNGIIPKEFMLHNAINLEEQVQKYYIKPVTNILNMLGWTLTETEGFF